MKDGTNSIPVARCEGIIDFIKRFFSIKTHSLDEFIGVVQREGGRDVVAEPKRKGRDGVMTASVGVIADYEYSTRFVSRSSKGRKIVFEEFHGSQIHTDYGFDASNQDRLAALKGLLTADDRLQRIKQQLPYVTIRLVGALGTMDETTRGIMYADAERNGVTPFEVS